MKTETYYKLKLDDDKTEALLIKLNRTTLPNTQPISLHVGSADIPFTTCARILDFMMSDYLSLETAIDSLKKGKSAGVNRTGPTRWIGCNHRSHDNLQQDLADRRMAKPRDPVLTHHTSQERQPAAVPELPNDHPHQSLKQSHTEDHTEQTEATSGEDHR